MDQAIAINWNVVVAGNVVTDSNDDDDDSDSDDVIVVVSFFCCCHFTYNDIKNCIHLTLLVSDFFIKCIYAFNNVPNILHTHEVKASSCADIIIVLPPLQFNNFQLVRILHT